MLKRVLFFLLAMNVFWLSQGQDTTDVKDIETGYYNTHVDSLLPLAIHKRILPEFQKPALIALSHYPELRTTKIVFVEKRIRTTAACRPKWTFLFRSRENRSYTIYINDDTEKMKGALFQDIPFDAQVGLIGHELGHVSDYSRRSALAILGLGFRYLFVSGRSQIEKRVDVITIAHHLGWQLYDFDYFIFYKSKVSKEYKAYKRKIYYAPEDLKKMIGKK
jgi:hypothetical protein